MRAQKYRGLIFDGALISGVMAGTVTVAVASCVIEQAMDHGEPAGAVLPARESGWIAWWPGNEPGLAEFTKRKYLHGSPCPYRVGERRYVKETWDCFAADYGTRKVGIVYRADGHREYVECPDWPVVVTLRDKPKWRSPMSMPRWAARTWIEITGVKPARCQEITEEEARLSGAECMAPEWPSIGNSTYWRGYAALWERLNAKRGLPWSLNAWVWRCTLKLCEAPK